MVWAVAWTDDTADALLADVKATGFLPDASDQSDSDLLGFADSELRTMIAAAVEASVGERFLRYEDTTIVPGTVSYRLPRRALAGSVRAVTVVDPSGVTLPPLAEVSPIQIRGMWKSGDTATPRFYTFEGDYVNLGAVEAGSGWTLRIHYVLRPGALVKLENYASLARIASAGSTTSLTVYDTTLASFAKYALFDIIRGSEPYMPAYLDRYAGSDYTSPGPTITLAAATPVVVADFTIETFGTYAGTAGREAMWWVPRDTTPFPMIPKVLWDALVHGTLAQALSAVRDPGAAAMRATALAKLQEGLATMKPRDARNSRMVIPQSSALRSGRGRGRRWWPS